MVVFFFKCPDERDKATDGGQLKENVFIYGYRYSSPVRFDTEKKCEIDASARILDVPRERDCFT